jgi:1-acyl-sn-glycerol-3-phosphate acyltransferase
MNDVTSAVAADAPTRDASWLSFLTYETTYFSSMAFMTLGFSLRTEGREHVPLRGPVLLIANHQSFFDPLLIGLSTRRHLHFLARKTLFRNRFFTALIRNLNAVPVDQEGVGKEGIETILGQLRLGHGVVVFPEGQRTGDGAVHELKPGVQLLIKLSRAPVVAVGIAGAFEAWPRWRPFPLPAPLFLPAGAGTIAVVVGRPLDVHQFAAMPRAQVLKELFSQLQIVQARAEKLRRKP